SLRIASLRLSEVENLARLYRDRMNQPENARAVLRSWLEDQRSRQLGPTDAEGRVTLAGQYEELLDDKAAAAELLHEAWKIDPKSPEVTDAFRRRGFRKINDEWVEPARARNGTVDAADPRPVPPMSKLANMTPGEVKALLGGAPNRVIYSASQGQI